MRFGILSCLLILASFICSAQPNNDNRLPLPSQTQLEWQNGELTMFVHFGPATWQDKEYDDLSTPLKRINPVKLNTDQWAQVAKSYGAKIIIFVAKHTGGFCWWQTNTSNYSVKEAGWRDGRGDVMKDLEASCEKYGLKLGVYLSPEDRYLNIGMGGKARNPAEQSKYEKIYREQLTELLTRYGSIKEVWVDGSLVFNVGDLIKKFAPKAVILQSSAATIRWVGNELGYAPYPAWNAVKEADAKSGNSTASNSDPDGDTWLPIEVDVSLRRPNWFWKSFNEKAILPLNELMKSYYLSVGRGTVFLINTSPDTTGLIPAPDVARLSEFGNEIKHRFGKPIAETCGRGKLISLKLPSFTKLDHVIVSEDIALGERVRSFVAEAHTKNGKWENLFTGSSIGHKLIIQFPEITADVIRFRFTGYKKLPVIKSLSVFYNQAPKVEIPLIKDNWNVKNAGEWPVTTAKNGLMEFTVDVTKYCKDAQPYEIAFVMKSSNTKQAQFAYDWAQTGLWTDNLNKEDRLAVIGSHLIFDGVEADQYLIHQDKFPDRVHFNLTGIAPKLLVNVKLRIPQKFSSGSVQAFILKK
ncbi:alpha-L-fucosidase [Inquilinus sp. KBS0705]|nr:alpha-L-fucosidase [Inquilinus sp. KBS0705]